MGIPARQFEKMRQRGPDPSGIARPSRPPVTSEETVRPGMNILGIDPSLRGTGYGVIRAASPHPDTLVHGTIRCPNGWEHSRCLLQIADELRRIIRIHHPDVCVVEGLFHAQNLKTALVMGEARGAALLAAAEAGLPIFEIAPRKVKQAVVGYGAAQKLAVARMVQRLLHLEELPASDAADALALAITHAYEARGIPTHRGRKV